MTTVALSLVYVTVPAAPFGPGAAEKAFTKLPDGAIEEGGEITQVPADKLPEE